MSYIFHTFFYNPIYNGLVYLIDILPNGDAGLAVILVTILVSFILFSVSKKAIKTQIRMKEMEPEMRSIKENVKDRQEQALKMMALYKKYEVNPFSMILLVILQIPVLLALYYVFLKGGLPEIRPEILYPFVSVPEVVSMKLFGFLDISQKSVGLAILAGVTQFLQARVATPKLEPKKEGATFKDDFQRSLGVQVKYVFPVIIGLISLSFPAALPLYWSTRNIFMTIQELYVRKNLKPKNQN
ncbi:MAG TPA: YidC/Oxa1 family membrane protein insertase [Candidatus Paceibacterota bacterium]|nr:YidC/Oxa1 family membrane protein insertase [Candidatus Paceibacterota bacterium]